MAVNVVYTTSAIAVDGYHESHPQTFAPRSQESARFDMGFLLRSDLRVNPGHSAA
jgi:hypothetical protein